MAHRQLYVGIDVHREKHQAAIATMDELNSPGEPWQKVRLFSFRNNVQDFESLNTLIKSHVSSPDQVSIAVDHTGGHYSEPLVYFLQMKGYSVYHLETKAVKAARERFLDEESKSDTIDSTSTAYMLYLRDLHGLSFRISAVTPQLESKATALKSLVLQRWQFHKLVNQATNRLHQLLLAVFPEGESRFFGELLQLAPYYPTPEDIVANTDLEDVMEMRLKDKEEIRRLATQTVGVPGELYRELIRSISLQRKEAITMRDEITLVIRREVSKLPYGEILLSFPFLGEIAAATIIGVVKDIANWPNKNKLKKAMGVYGNISQSGSGTSKPRQGREGNRHARRVLFQICFGCIRTNVQDNDFRDYYLRQVARGKPKLKALVSTMGKLAEIIYHCLKVKEPYIYQAKYKTAITSGGYKS